MKFTFQLPLNNDLGYSIFIEHSVSKKVAVKI